MTDFPETADIETSSDTYAKRFSGKSGAWMLAVQERVTKQLLKDVPASATVLDVGGGHGQLAIPFAEAGHPVTILGSDESCRHRVRELVDAGKATFVVGNVVALPFGDDAFDVVLCFRLVTHCVQWERLIAELCRVARHCVVVDYPTSQSVNCIAPALFGAKKKLEGDTRHWALFTHAQIREAFVAAGWRVARTKKQFFLPMVLHRALSCAPLSAAAETVCRLLGLTAWAGSPVVARATHTQR
jgi:2-polyprenyl-3-methyl-5-hydroxy-6-metoxy-1,4-benzoquinol methylase